MPNTVECKSCTLKSEGKLNVIGTDVLVLSNTRFVNTSYTPKMWRGIWDTGASGSCINQRIVDDLKLIPVGRKQISTAGGLKETNTYLVDIGLPNNVIVRNILVSCADLGENLDVLIGMDIISLGDFAITNFSGRTTFSFRLPSVASIDFCKTDNPYTQFVR